MAASAVGDYLRRAVPALRHEHAGTCKPLPVSPRRLGGVPEVCDHILLLHRTMRAVELTADVQARQTSRRPATARCACNWMAAFSADRKNLRSSPCWRRPLRQAHLTRVIVTAVPIRGTCVPFCCCLVERRSPVAITLSGFRRFR
jgi:hypothetical protein